MGRVKIGPLHGLAEFPEREGGKKRVGGEGKREGGKEKFLQTVCHRAKEKTRETEVADRGRVEISYLSPGLVRPHILFHL